ncbi:MAG TPA: ATP-binding protein [Conexibacter sp.]|nr:ATP-binding protein [Conexibacter sp.]
MALTDDEILGQNRWWTDASWHARDPHLDRLERQPMRLSTEVVATLDLDLPGIHILRGPRQVGKSTDLKLLVRRAIDAGRAPRSIVYLALDLLEGQPHAELARTVRRAKDLAGGSERCLLLLDEVTAVERWQTAVKALWDSGDLRQDVVACTGSSAIDLQQGAAERLPGRREAGVDHLLLPQSFAAFARAVDATVPRSPRLSVGDLCTTAGVEALHEARLHAPALERSLQRYLRFGGLPASVAEAAGGADVPSAATRRVLSDSLARELQRRGASLPACQALLERVARSLGSKTSWSQMAREMDVPLGRGRGRPSHHTLRDYIELMAAGYFLLVVYYWRSGAETNEQSKDKKVLFADPLLHTIALDSAPGLQPDIPALVENIVGVALYRGYEPTEHLPETFALPERLHIWQTARGGEIDFVCGPRRSLDVVEVKYRSDPGRSAAAAAARAHPGRPVVLVTKDVLAPGDAYSLIPAHLLLWALG